MSKSLETILKAAVIAVGFVPQAHSYSLTHDAVQEFYENLSQSPLPTSFNTERQTETEINDIGLPIPDLKSYRSVYRFFLNNRINNSYQNNQIPINNIQVKKALVKDNHSSGRVIENVAESLAEMQTLLAFDGGGLRGVASCAIIEKLSETVNEIYAKLRGGHDGTKIPLNQVFSNIAGTSTGALIATAIALGKSPEEIKTLYYKNAKKIFSPTYQWGLRQVMQLVWKTPMYTQEGLEATIRQFLGSKANIKLSEINSVRLLITVCKADTNESILYDSKLAKEDPSKDIRLMDLLLSTTAAPTYFPPMRVKRVIDGVIQEDVYLDGGVGANNPTQIAFNRLGKEAKKVFVVSIGTGTVNNFTMHPEKLGYLGWGQYFIQSVTDSDRIHHLIQDAFIAASASDNYYRFQPVISEKNMAMDNTDIENLKALYDSVKKNYVKNLYNLFDEVGRKIVAVSMAKSIDEELKSA